jgi:hypothetical protein
MARKIDMLVLTVAAVLGTWACSSEDTEHERVLDELVNQGAQESVVTARLGAGATVYERDTPSWSDLQTFLSREPETALVPLRRAVQSYPKILYYTTAYRMTWLFFDKDHKLREYYLAAQ